ncbi:hypothetical protein ASG90_18310 [Nocardioides sp. Soil797]|nr:hypothetical protein ASG90_18310 [Nocardioides sp. Soil797]
MAAAVALATGLGALTSPSHAADSVTPELQARALAAKASQSISASAVLKSNKRKKLHVALSAGSGNGGGSLSVSLADTAGEQHAWSFKVAAKTLKLNGKGKGKLVTKKIKPFGTIKLTISPSGKWKVKKCKGKVISKSRPLKVKGLFTFDSKSAWGKVGGKKVTFKGAKVTKSTGVDGSACDGGDGGDGGDGDACSGASIMWSAFRGGVAMSSQWAPGSTKAGMFASRSTKLAKPKGATRTDFRSAMVPVPATTVSGGSVSIQVNSKAPATGSATLSSSTGYPLERTCEKTKTYTTTFWSGVSYQNGATPLALKMSAYGSLKLPNGADAVIQQQSKAS